jgi:CMP-N-acetylneuraminic acid synthetase
MKSILITICGRGGSKGIPGKNIRELNGKPLIAYTISTAKRFADIYNADIGLSTDSPDIKAAAEKFGLRTEYTRPAEMATDNAGKLQVIADLMAHHEKLRGKKYDLVIDLDITSPLRTSEDLSAAMKILEENPEAVNLFSVSKAHRNPYFNMVEQQEDGFYNLVKKGNFTTRQSSPKVYDLNASFYIFKRHYFDSYTSAITPKSLIYEVPHLCFDLDEPIDFEFMEYLVKNNKTGIEL